MQIREIRLSSGAEFLVVVCGSIMTMPGLPKTPAADVIRINDKGDIDGLFKILVRSERLLGALPFPLTGNNIHTPLKRACLPISARPH